MILNGGWLLLCIICIQNYAHCTHTDHRPPANHCSLLVDGLGFLMYHCSLDQSYWHVVLWPSITIILNGLNKDGCFVRIETLDHSSPATSKLCNRIYGKRVANQVHNKDPPTHHPLTASPRNDCQLACVCKKTQPAAAAQHLISATGQQQQQPANTDFT